MQTFPWCFAKIWEFPNEKVIAPTCRLCFYLLIIESKELAKPISPISTFLDRRIKQIPKWCTCNKTKCMFFENNVFLNTYSIPKYDRKQHVPIWVKLGLYNLRKKFSICKMRKRKFFKRLVYSKSWSHNNQHWGFTSP